MADLNALMRLINEMNLSDADLRNLKNAETMANKFQGKDEEEILQEILKMKESFTKDRAAFKKQLSLLKAMRPMLSVEQKKNFDKILGIIEKW